MSALAREDVSVQLLLNGQCVAAAARTWFLAAGLPVPGLKWLLSELHTASGGGKFAEVLRVLLGVDTPKRAESWFDAHLVIWEMLDRHVDGHGISTD